MKGIFLAGGYKMCLHPMINPDLLGGRLTIGRVDWVKIAYNGVQTVFSNKVVRTYFISEPGRTSMSDSKRYQGAKRIMLFKLLWISYFDQRLIGSFKWKLSNIISAKAYGFTAKLRTFEIISKIKSNPKKIIAILSAPIALLISLKWREND